jgi:hypothetical protein
MAAAQAACPDVTTLKSSMQVVSQPVGTGLLVGDNSTGTFRPFVPMQYRRRVFDQLYGAGHPGGRASR